MAKGGNLVIGGVPEPFNLPLDLVNDTGLLKHGNVKKVHWKKVSEGTAALIEGLHNGSFHVVTALTEGAIAAVAKDSTIEIIGSYIDSPLNWGVITSSQQDKFNNLEDLRSSMVKVGVSRYGSGSHLMPLILAKQQSWQYVPEFVVFNNFAGLRESVCSGNSDIFMWEWFMTKPYVEEGLLKFIGSVPTPWPCVCFVTTKKIVEEFGADLFAALSAIRTTALAFRAADSSSAESSQFNRSVEQIVTQFSFKREDAESWLKSIQFSKDGQISVCTIRSVCEALCRAGVIDKEATDPSRLVHPTFLNSLAFMYDNFFLQVFF
eukprot:jgi/Galph1/956/GphlegSOOS_G5701.1